MKRNRNWRGAGYTVSVRRGDGKVYTQEEAFRPVVTAFDDVLDVGRERAMMRDVQAEMTGLIGESSRGMFPDRKVIFDSGWYDHRPGDPLPPIESFRISR